MRKGCCLFWTIVTWPIPLHAQTSVQPAGEPAWEVRSVLGMEQSAASAADSRLAYLLDFFVDRALGSERDAANANWLVWGNIRLASMPIQQGSFGTLLGNGVGGIVNLNTNQLVQSAEFQTGV